MNLINGTHNFCERKKYIFNILPEYNIITHVFVFLKEKEKRLRVLVLMEKVGFNTFLFPMLSPCLLIPVIQKKKVDGTMRKRLKDCNST
jgi:hypothetical protein